MLRSTGVSPRPTRYAVEARLGLFTGVAVKAALDRKAITESLAQWCLERIGQRILDDYQCAMRFYWRRSEEQRESVEICRVA